MKKIFRKITGILLIMTLLMPSSSVFAGESNLEQIKDKFVNGSGESDGYIYETKDGDIEEADSLKEISKEENASDIKIIEPNYIVKLSSMAYYDDPGYLNNIGNLSLMNTDSLFERNYAGKSSVRVAVIDTGLDSNNTDINYNRVLIGKNFSDTNNVTTDTEDDRGHGTAVTGIIAGIRGNSIGVAGIAPNVTILPLKVFDGQYASDASIVKAIEYAIKLKVDVINMSLGGDDYCEILKDACEKAEDAGIICCAASGNADIDNGEKPGNTPTYPASFDSVVAVGSISNLAEISLFSYRGNDVVAPGENVGILTTTSGKIAFEDGTSFSSPYVAALAALCKSYDKSMTTSEFKAYLQSKSTDLGTKGVDSIYGAGVINYKNFCMHKTTTTFKKVASIGIEGYIKTTCSYCGKVLSTTTIPALSPNPTSLTLVKSSTKKTRAFTAKWKSKDYTGYQFKYWKNGYASKAKTCYTKLLTKRITGLSSGTYYVEVRTYKTVNGTKYFSTWTKKKITI